MNSVIFGDKDSYKDLGILLRPKSRPKPTPIYEKITIPGKSGDLDFSEWTGDVIYNNLSYKLEFNVIDPINTWDEKIRTITNYLHGKKMKVTFSDDVNYYYLGRVKINELSSNKTLGILSIECDFEPYKYKQALTKVSHKVSAGNTYNFNNERMHVVPTFTLDSAMTIEYEGVSYSLNAGTSKVRDIQFKEGTNTIKVVTGTGTLTAEYQEASL